VWSDLGGPAGAPSSAMSTGPLASGSFGAPA
jgi:hypothetical protein